MQIGMNEAPASVSLGDNVDAPTHSSVSPIAVANDNTSRPVDAMAENEDVEESTSTKPPITYSDPDDGIHNNQGCSQSKTKEPITSNTSTTADEKANPDARATGNSPSDPVYVGESDTDADDETGVNGYDVAETAGVRDNDVVLIGTSSTESNRRKHQVHAPKTEIPESDNEENGHISSSGPSCKRRNVVEDAVNFDRNPSKRHRKLSPLLSSDASSGMGSGSGSDIPKEKDHHSSTLAEDAETPFPEQPQDCISTQEEDHQPEANIVNGVEEFEVNRILGKRRYRRGRRWKTKYLVHWRGYSHRSNSWEPHENLENAMDLVREFEKKAMADKKAVLA